MGWGRPWPTSRCKGAAIRPPPPTWCCTLDRWLSGVLNVSTKSILAALSTHDSRFYREPSEQAWLFLTALRRSLEEDQ